MCYLHDLHAKLKKNVAGCGGVGVCVCVCVWEGNRGVGVNQSEYRGFGSVWVCVWEWGSGVCVMNKSIRFIFSPHTLVSTVSRASELK